MYDKFYYLTLDILKGYKLTRGVFVVIRLSPR